MALPSEDPKEIAKRKHDIFRQMIVNKDGEPITPPPQSYWDFMAKITPPFRMGKVERPLCWRLGFNGPPGAVNLFHAHG